MPQIIYCRERINSNDLYITNENYYERKKIALQKLDAVVLYISSRLKCRSTLLLQYFGDETPKRCGQCDICIERNKLGLTEMEFDKVVDYIKPFILNESHTLEEVVSVVKGVREDYTLHAIQWLIDNEKIKVDEEQMLKWGSLK